MSGPRGYPIGVKPKNLRGVPIKATPRRAKQTHLVNKAIDLRPEQVVLLDHLSQRWRCSFAQAVRTVIDWGLEEERER